LPARAARRRSSAFRRQTLEWKIRALQIDKLPSEKQLIALAGWQMPTGWHAPQDQFDCVSA